MTFWKITYSLLHYANAYTISIVSNVFISSRSEDFQFYLHVGNMNNLIRTVYLHVGNINNLIRTVYYSKCFYCALISCILTLYSQDNNSCRPRIW